MNKQKDVLLATELRALVTRLIKKLRKKSATGAKLSLTERSTLGLLYQHQELLATELAAMEKITTQSMSQILSNLQQRGMIKRRISDTDKRKVIISLSDEGREAITMMQNEKDEWLQKALEATCTPQEQDLLKQLLVPLAKLVDFD